MLAAPELKKPEFKKSEFEKPELKKTASALIMAGGTGGHIFPGIAVANELVSRGWDINWLGSKNGMEERLVNAEGFKLNLISVSGLRGNGLLGWIKAPYSLTRAVFESISLLRKISPNVVIGFGGFASGPGGLAAYITGTPLVIHEQNAIAGLTNKVLTKLARMTFQAFPNAFGKREVKDKLLTVGNPVRKNILAIDRQPDKQKTLNDKLNILVVGGSRGALALNRYLPGVFSELLKNKSKNKTIAVHHQVGKNRLQETATYYGEAGLENNPAIKMSEFIEDMAKAYLWADIVICRSGASTVSEVAAVGIAAIFIPYPYAVDDHQTANADWLVKNRAALCFSENELKDKAFINRLIEVIDSSTQLNEMASNAKKMAYINAASDVADYCDILRKQAA